MPATGPMMTAPAASQPEIVETPVRRVACDGASAIRSTGGYKPAALGHPRVWLEIDERGYVDCGYCDRRFVLMAGAGMPGTREFEAGDLPAPGDSSVA